MSLHGTTSGDVAAPDRQDSAERARRWRWRVPSVPHVSRVPLPVTGAIVYAGIRVLSVLIAAFVMGHGAFHASRHASLARWLQAGDGGFYLNIAAHGYTYPHGQLARASVFSFFPAYPAAMRLLAWLPGVTLVGAGLAVTAIAGLAAAAGIATLGMKLTASPRISVLMAAIWAVAPASTVLEKLYAEALFCALAVWALVALVDRRWLTAAGLTVVAGTVRSIALALFAAIAVAALAAVVADVRAGQGGTWWRPAAWWRPLAAAVIAPLGLLGYLGYVAVRTGRADGWFWIERHNFHMAFDWGASTLRVMRGVFLGTPSVDQVLVTLAVIAGALLLLVSLTERIPLYLHVYTAVVVIVALVTSANWIGSKPRFMLPAMLLALPVARLLAPLRTSVLVPLIVVLTAAATWFGLYLNVIARWAP